MERAPFRAAQWSPCRGGAYRAILSKLSGRLGSGLRRLRTLSRRPRSEKGRRMLRVELLAKGGSYWIGFATKTTLRPSVSVVTHRATLQKG
jgi:hypothetical protein